jgi:hypothetical protein
VCGKHERQARRRTVHLAQGQVGGLAPSLPPVEDL